MYGGFSGGGLVWSTSMYVYMWSLRKVTGIL